MTVLRLLPLLSALLLLAPGDDDEIVREFRRYFREYVDTPTRVEAILALEGTDSRAVVEVLVPILEDPEPRVVDACVRVLAGLATPPAVEALRERLEDERSDEIVLELLEVWRRGRWSGAGERLAELLEDRDWRLRRGALAALLATARSEAVAAALAATEDPEPAVRCEALDGLAALGAPEAVAAALASLEDEVWQVRASAIAALARVRHRDAIAPLIERLALEEGRLREDAGRALDAITGKSYGRRLDLWRSFWERYGDVFEIPTEEELARLRTVQAEREAAYEGPAPEEVRFAGVDTPSRSIVFVIDVSGSMEQEVVEKERYRDGGYPSYRRIDIVKTELARTIERLERDVEFTILAFATEVVFWKDRLVSASPPNKSSALTFVERLEAIGGASKVDLARAGLVGASRLEEGRTNTYGALMAALGMGGRRGEYAVAVDTIFFLSDGRPSTGDYVETGDVLREVLEENELRRIVIHSLAIGEFERDFLRELATTTGGLFVDLGR